MAIQVQNRLTGTAGQQVSNATLATSAELGTVTINAPSARGTYNTTQTVYDLPTVRVQTGYRRTTTPTIQTSLPATGPWSARWYVWMPRLQDAGYGINEVRWHAQFPDAQIGLVIHATAAGNVGTRLQPWDLASTAIMWDVEDGTATAVGQWWRIELVYDGTNLTCYTYDGHNTASPRIHTWNNRNVGRTLAVGGYRYRRGLSLSYGNTTISQDVRDYQNYLIALGFPAPQWGADGFYGGEMVTQLTGFANAYGFGDLVGSFGAGGGAGPEILSGISLAYAENGGATVPPPLYLSSIATAQGEMIGPVSEPVTEVEGDGEPLGVVFDFESSGTVIHVGEGEPLGVEFDLQAEGLPVFVGDGEDLGVVFDLEEGQGSQFFNGDGEDLGVTLDLTEGEGTPTFVGEGEMGVIFDFTDGGAELHFNGDGEDLSVEFDLTSDVHISGDGEPLGVVFDLTSTGGPESYLPDVPLVGLRYRLVAYDPDGERRGQLPYPLALTLGVPHNDMPSLTLEYLKSAPGATLLSDPCEVAVEIAPAGSGTFVEYPGCRFLNIREREDLTDRTGVVRYTMPEYAWMLRKVRNINNSAFNDDGERAFTRATVGTIFHTFLTETQGRGNIPGMSWDFTTTHDSAGRPWTTVYNIAFSGGQDLWSTLDALANQGALDWRMHRRTLQLYVIDTALNRDLTDDIILRLHRDVTDAPNDSSAEDLAATIFVQGDGEYARITTTGSMRPWGAWEDYISQSGVSDSGTLLALGQWRLEKTRALRRQMTRGLLFNTTEYLPFIHYLPGDRITSPGAFSQSDPLRVRQITLSSLDSQGMEGNVVLNDRFLERELRRDKQINALTGGASGTPGGGGGRPGEDTRTPKAPESLLLSTSTYLTEAGDARGQITATWELVEEATNNTEMDIREYQVFTRKVSFNQTFAYQTTVTDPDDVAFMSPFEVDEVYEVRVRAIGRNGRTGLWSAVNSIRVEPDAIAPPTPSTQVLSSRLSVANVFWDGLTWDGLRMPADFSHVRVWKAHEDTMEFEWINSLYSTGSVAVADLEYGTEYWFYLTAVDRTGNESDPSPMTSIQVEELVPSDFFGPGSIGYELLEEGAVRDDILADDAVMNRHVAAGQITGEKIRAYSIFADRLAIGASRNLLADPQFRDADLSAKRMELATGLWEYGSLNGLPTIGFVMPQGQGVYSFPLVQSVDAVDRSDIHAGIPVTSEIGRVVGRAQVSALFGGVSGSVAVTGMGRFLDINGNVVSELGVMGRQVLTTSNSSYELLSVTGAAVPDDAVSMIPYFVVEILGDTPSGLMLSFRQPFFALSNGSVLIENGAVTANKVAANAITADKIDVGAVTAGHIAATAIDGMTITGALIQSTTSVNRGLKIDTAGIRGYNSVGTETFTYNTTSGLVRTTGRFQSEVNTSNSVVMDANLYNGRPAVQLNTNSSADLQPVMYSLGTGSSGYPAGALLVHGRETTLNSTGRQTLQLNSGSGTGASLTQEYGLYAGIGFSYSAWSAMINGRNEAGHGRLQYMVWGQTSTFAATEVSAVDIAYGQAAANGSRLVHVTGTSNTTQYARIAVGTTGPSISGVRLVGQNISGSGNQTSFRLNYTAHWVSSSTA